MGNEYWLARELNANKIHYIVGKKIRKTIKELGGTIHKNLPKSNKSIRELEKENNLIK